MRNPQEDLEILCSCLERLGYCMEVRPESPGSLPVIPVAHQQRLPRLQAVDSVRDLRHRFHWERALLLLRCFMAVRARNRRNSQTQRSVLPFQYLQPIAAIRKLSISTVFHL